MNTNPVTPAMNHNYQTTTRFSRFGRMSLAVACVSFASFTAAPKALAGVDGKYEFKSSSGSLKYDGDSVDIPKKLVKRIAAVVDGDITIKDSQLRVNKNGTVKIIENFGDDLDLDVEASATGPTRVTLKKVGSKKFTGKTSSPIVTSFEGDVFGKDFSGTLRTRVTANVDGKNLTLIIRFSGRTLGEDFSGRITVTARK